MKKLNNNLFWMIPLYFFIFLFLFISFKFIFIFFFRAAFEPRFIFELTPFYIFSGITNLQLLFLSLVIVFYDTYLHIKATRKNLLYSFIPTSVMLCGLALEIVTKGISIDNFPYYLLFGLLLFVVLVDHRRTLLYPETLAATKLAKPEPLLPTTPKPTKALTAGKPRISFHAISSIFTIFKRGKKTDRPKEETETPKASEAIKSETPKKVEETVQIDEIKKETPKEEAPFEPVTEDEIPKFTEPFPSKTEEKEEGYIQPSIGAPSGSTSAEAASGELPQFFEAKEDIAAYKSDSYKSSPVEKDKHKEILETVEKIYPKELGLTEEQIELKKKKIGITPGEKPVIPKAELEMLKRKIADHKKEIETKTTVVQDVKTDFKNIQGGLDSLKNKLENLGGEIQSTIQDSAVSRRKETKPPYISVERRKVEREIAKQTSIPQKHRLETRRTSLKKAQTILKELDKRVEKLERIYLY